MISHPACLFWQFYTSIHRNVELVIFCVSWYDRFTLLNFTKYRSTVLMDMAFTHKAQTSNYLKRTYLQQRETPPAHKLTSWQGMELSLEGAPLSKRLSPTSLSKQAPLSRKLSRGAVSPGESAHPVKSPRCSFLTWCRLLSRAGKLLITRAGVPSSDKFNLWMVLLICAFFESLTRQMKIYPTTWS